MADTPVRATASTYACAVPKLPSWFWATSAITAQRSVHNSDNIGKVPLHTPEVECPTHQDENRRGCGCSHHWSRRCVRTQKRPAEPSDDSSHRIQPVHRVPWLLEQTARISDGR